MQILVQDSVAAAAEWTCGPFVLLGIDAHGLKRDRQGEERREYTGRKGEYYFSVIAI